MDKKEVISILYGLKNEAYNKLQELDHPDCRYCYDEKVNYRERFECYDKCLGLLLRLD